MTDSSGKTRPVELRQLIGLLDEIGALVRAGVPLEHGLRTFAEGNDEVAQRLIGRMEQGKSLADALDAEGDSVPPAVQSVIRAGLKSNRLGVALEAISNLGWELLDLRQRVSRALAYPLFLIIVAYTLSVTFIHGFHQQLESTYLHTRLEPSISLEVCLYTGELLRTWWPLPLVLLIGSIFYWTRTKDGRLIGLTGPARVLRFIPGVRGIIKDHQLAIFAELHAIMLSQDVPYSESIRLSAYTTGSNQLIASADQIATRVDNGEPPFPADTSAAIPFPPYLAWLLQTAHHNNSLIHTLQQTADRYRRRACSRVDRLRALFPFCAALVVGGTVLMFYLLSVALPYLDFLSGLSTPVIP